MTTPRSDPVPPSGSDEDPIVDRRLGTDRRARERRRSDVPVPRERRTGQDRRKTERRRSMNRYEMTPDEMELAKAIQVLRDRTGRFPTVGDLLGLIRELGYEKQA